MIIACGVSEQLDELKHAYAGLPSMLTHLVETELERIPRSLRAGLTDGQQMWSIVYMPQVRLIDMHPELPGSQVQLCKQVGWGCQMRSDP